MNVWTSYYEALNFHKPFKGKQVKINLKISLVLDTLQAWKNFLAYRGW